MFRSPMTVGVATKIFRIAGGVYTVGVLLLWQSESFGPIMRWGSGMLALASLNMYLHMWLAKRKQSRE